MRISYDPEVDALYIAFHCQISGQRVIRLNDRVAINIGPEEQIVGIEVLDASIPLPDIGTKAVQLENRATA